MTWNVQFSTFQNVGRVRTGTRSSSNGARNKAGGRDIEMGLHQPPQRHLMDQADDVERGLLQLGNQHLTGAEGETKGARPSAPLRRHGLHLFLLY